MFKWNCSGCNNWKKSVWHSFLTNRHHQHNYKSVMYILFVHYVTIMYCCQDAAGQQGQWHHQHRLRGPAGQVSCDWSEYHNTDLWLAEQDRAAHGHRQREHGDAGAAPREQGDWEHCCYSHSLWIHWVLFLLILISILKLMDTAFNLISIEASTTTLQLQTTHETRYTGKLDHFLWK